MAKTQDANMPYADEAFDRSYPEELYDLEELVALNRIIEVLAGIDPVQDSFMRDDIISAHMPAGGGAARKVYDAILCGEVTPIIKVTLRDHHSATQLEIPYHVASRETFDEFLEQINLFAHPEHTLYTTGETVERLWPQLERIATAKPRPRPLPASQDDALREFIRKECLELGAEKTLAKIRDRYPEHTITRGRVRKLHSGIGARGKPGPKKNA